MKTMNKIIFWTMAAFAFLFASCAGEEEVTTPANPLKNKPINVDVLVSDIKTRAGYDTDNLPTQFYLTIDQGGEGYDYTNVVMKHEDGKWVAYASDAANANKIDMLWAGSQSPITVTAATFPLSGASTSYTLSALTDQSTAEDIKASDHLYYYSNAVTPSSDGTISIPFDHVMSKLEVKVTLRNQYGGSGSNPITSAIVFGSATSATYTITEGLKWNELSAASDITPCLSADNSTNRIATYEAILIPQEIAASTFGVKVTIDGKSYTWKSANLIQLQGGMKYTLDLTLGKNELTLNTLSVGDWKDETVTGLNAELVIPYVTFTAENSQTCRFFISKDFASELGDNGYFEYSVGDGEWVQFKSTVDSIPFGGTLGSLRLRGKSSKGTAISGSRYSKIEFKTENSLVDCTGDIRTLIDYENYADVSTANAKFCSLFYLNTQLRTAPSLPATTLASYCYRQMFSGCSSLTQAPALPATTLANNCYLQMFSGCSSLTQAPALAATTLADNCYQEMFSGCTSLTQAPVLPATILAEYCYFGMFSGCSSLTQAPALPATTLADHCYLQMFSGCTQLTQAPELPATTLAESCYYEMFRGCSALTQAPVLPATTLARSCYEGMFGGCTQLTQAPSLPAKTLKDNCYSGMFSGCTQLTQAPELPATTLAGSCYYEMFRGCSSLTEAPSLPAKTLADYCYSQMFSDCTALSIVAMLATNIEAYMCLTDWLTNAGTNVSSTLILDNQKVHDAMLKEEYKNYNYLPVSWNVTILNY